MNIYSYVQNPKNIYWTCWRIQKKRFRAPTAKYLNSAESGNSSGEPVEGEEPAAKEVGMIFYLF